MQPKHPNTVSTNSTSPHSRSHMTRRLCLCQSTFCQNTALSPRPLAKAKSRKTLSQPQLSAWKLSLGLWACTSTIARVTQEQLGSSPDWSNQPLVLTLLTESLTAQEARQGWRTPSNDLTSCGQPLQFLNQQSCTPLWRCHH